jgi:hypothetical protein
LFLKTKDLGTAKKVVAVQGKKLSACASVFSSSSVIWCEARQACTTNFFFVWTAQMGHNYKSCFLENVFKTFDQTFLHSSEQMLLQVCRRCLNENFGFLWNE